MAMKDITLYDGTRIPRGTILAAAADPIHHDEAILKDAGTFDPFRYANIRSAAADEGLRHVATSTSPEYIPFGHGPYAWCVCLIGCRPRAIADRCTVNDER